LSIRNYSLPAEYAEKEEKKEKRLLGKYEVWKTPRGSHVAQPKKNGKKETKKDEISR